MALAPFFDRVYASAGRHLSVTRDALEAKLKGVVVGVDATMMATENDATIARLSVNLLSRLYPELSIAANGDLLSELQAIARSINPEIELFGKSADDLTIAVGNPVGAQVHARADGWVSSVGGGLPKRLPGPDNSITASAAACFAVAEIFRRVFLGISSIEEFSLSLLDFSPDFGRDEALGPIVLPPTLMVGVGAVGNAAIWTLSKCPMLSGSLTLLDHEELDLANCQRYVLASPSLVGRKKVEIATEALSRAGVQIASQVSTIENAKLDEQIPVCCVSVDNIAGRRAAQALLPRLVINGWTGDSALGASWHAFNNGSACLACLYHPSRQGRSQTDLVADALGLSPERATLLWVQRAPLSNEELRAAAERLGLDEKTLRPWRKRPIGDLYTDVVCGAVPLDLRGVGKLETVPLAHQSALAGVLMAAELVKRTRPDLEPKGQKDPLVTWDDILRPPPPHWTRPRARERGCICGDSIYQRVYERKWGPRTRLDLVEQ